MVEYLSPAIRHPLVIAVDQSVADAAALMEQARSMGTGVFPAGDGAMEPLPLLQRGRAGCVVVMDADQVVGLLTTADVVRYGAGPRPLAQVGVAEAMVRPQRFVQVAELVTAEAVLQIGEQTGYAPLPVLNDRGQLIGLYTVESWLWLAQQHKARPAQRPLNQRPPVAQPIKTLGVDAGTPSGTLASAPDGSPDRQRNGKPQFPVADTLLHDIISSTKACIAHLRLFTDGDWYHDFISDGSKLIFGFSPAELLAQPDLWASRLVETDLETVIIPAAHAVLQGQTHLDIEFRYRHRDGTVRWIAESCNARWDEAQQCWMLTNVAIDITERKQLEAHLRQSEAELRALFEAMDDLVMVLDREGRYLKVVTNDSSKLCRPAPQLIGKTLAEVFPPEQARQFLAVVHNVLDAQAPDEFEYVVNAGGKERWFSAKCSAINTDQIVWVARDVSDRKQNELSLRQSEAKRRAILTAMPDLMFRLGADGRYREVINPRPDLELFFQGRDPVGQKLKDLVPAEVANRKLAMKDKALATGALQLYEQQMQTNTGPRYEEVRVIKSDDDEVLFMIRDISDRKIAELQLEATRNLLQEVINHLPVAVFVKDASTLRLTLWNDTCTALMGYTPAEVMGKTDFDLFPAEQARTSVEYDRQAIDQRRVVEVPEETIQGADGQPRIIHNRKVAVYDAQGNASLVIGIAEDITDRKRAETTLRRQLAAIEAAVDGIGILQGDHYLYMNQAHARLFGYETAAELVGKSWRALYPPAEIQRFKQEVFPLLERDRAWQGEATALRRDGSTFAEGLSLTLTDDDSLICVCRDISELKQAQAQIIHNSLHDPPHRSAQPHPARRTIGDCHSTGQTLSQLSLRCAVHRPGPVQGD
jgi:PAS domain S-box-containing protein